MEKTKKMKKEKNPGRVKEMFKRSGTRRGSYSVGLTILVLAVVIVFNLVVGQIPEAYRNIDVSTTKIYEISETTTTLLDGLEDEVEMTVLAVKEDTDERITTFISKYAALSGKISVEWIDPVLHPTALTEYDTEEDTIVVSCEATGRSTIVDFDDILVFDEYYYYYYGTTSYTEFDGEGQLSSAVNYVTNETEQTIYIVSGHGEASLSDTITDLMSKNNFTTEEIELPMVTEIPDDCDLLLMNGPETDLLEDEAALLSDYLAAGGKVMILLGEENLTEMPYLSEVLAAYGIEGVEGYIADTSRCYQNNPYYIFPVLSVSGDLANNITSSMVLVTYPQGLSLADLDSETIVTSGFMSTSDYGYAVTDDGQEQGTYYLGVIATETITVEDEEEDDDEDADEDTDEDADEDSDDEEEAEDLESRLTVISAGSLISSDITDYFSSLENTQLFMNAVTANFDGVTNLSIEAKSLETEYNTVQYGGLFSALAVFIIPAVILIAGFLVWFRRRKA